MEAQTDTKPKRRRPPRKQLEVPGAEKPTDEELDALCATEIEADEQITAGREARTDARDAILGYMTEHKIEVYKFDYEGRTATYKRSELAKLNRSIKSADDE